MTAEPVAGRRFRWPGVGTLGPAEFVVSLYLLAGLMVLVLAALLLEGNGPKAIRVGLSAVAHLAILVGGSRTRLRAVSPLKPAPLLLFVLAGSGAGLVSGLARVDPMLQLVVTQTVAAGLLLGGFHGFTVRAWRRLRERTVGAA